MAQGIPTVSEPTPYKLVNIRNMHWGGIPAITTVIAFEHVRVTKVI